MPSMFFGHYLLGKGAIKREALLDAIRRQREVNLTLPDLAVREGLLERRAADSIMALFRTSARSIDELCRSRGLSQEAVDSLLAIQQRERRLIGDCLVEGGHLSRDQVDSLLASFRTQEQVEQQRIESSVGASPRAVTIRTCLDLSVFHLQRIASAPVKLQEVDGSDGRLAGGTRRYAQRVVGGEVFTLAMDLTDPLARVVAEGFLGAPVEVGSETAQDAVCEFVNVVGGNVCTKLERPGHRLVPEPPYATARASAGAAAGSAKAIVLCDETPFTIQVFL